jgi:GGDEF domain-containing protein
LILLIQLSKRINDVLRAEDLAVRLGGDEFVILIKAQNSNLIKTTEQVTIIAEK